MSIQITYTAANCNQTPTAADWGKNNLICYGTCNSVLIYDPNWGSGGKIIDNLVAHTKRVNSVKWLSHFNCDNEVETELVSGGADGVVILWKLEDGGYVAHQLKEHKMNVNIVDAIYFGDDKSRSDAFIVSGSIDSTVKVWRRRNEKEPIDLFTSINFDYHIATAIKLAPLKEQNDLILILGLDSSTMNIYIKNDDGFGVQHVLKGHFDWVRGLDVTLNGNDLLLASSSQDAYIKLWTIAECHSNEALIKSEKHNYVIKLKTVLTGHEGWIYSVKWSPCGLQLLSASIDKTMILWEYDEVSELWIEKVRLGEVGGNTLGFYTGLFSPDGGTILGYSYHGAFHLWELKREVQSWEPKVTVGGHFAEVVDLGWDPRGEFLISVSSDQTTRIHAPWVKDNKKLTWHEIARPQVHGHNLFCLAVLSRYKFASGAEEKVVRTFEAPQNFVENFRRICRISDDKEGDSILCGAKGASVPSLGLSNKAVFTDDNIEDVKNLDPKNPYAEESHFSATQLSEPPTEETLLENTLWPEIQKLYGHGYEIYSLASSPDGKYLASACKSTSQEHAAIIIWDTKTWEILQKLVSHTLTVVQMEFSPNSQQLLAVSRDRRWTLFTKTEDKFELTATTDKKTSVHTRIIWSCSWSPDSLYFATGSREGKVVVWTKDKTKEKQGNLGQYEAVSILDQLKNQSVTAVAFAPKLIAQDYCIAVGLEIGEIHFYRWNSVQSEFRSLQILQRNMAHSLAVLRLKFRPIEGDNVIQLASAGADYLVRVYDIDTDKF